MAIKDFLIIGQGIAGSLLAYKLLQKNQSLDILNIDINQSSSKVAAGLYNPITGRKMVKTWNCDDIFPGLERYYQSLEETLGVRFLHPIGIYRPFFSAEEQNDWQGKISDPSYSYLVKELRRGSSEDPKVNDEFGGIVLNHSGYLDLPVMLNAFQNYFKSKGVYREEVFSMKKLSLINGHCNYENNKYRKVIFCDGIGAKDNPYFDWLPFKLVKGEILDISINYSRENVLNRGVFLLPLDTNLFRLGATYNNHDLTFDATSQAIDYLQEKLNLIFNGQFEIIKHRVGIRPATKDRRPFIGTHRDHKQIGIFNGMGAKGVSLAAYYSKQFVENLLEGKALDDEVNIRRFFSLI